MDTRRFIPLTLLALTLLLVSCTGAAAPAATATPTPLAPTNTPLPDVTVTPTPTPPGSTEGTPPAPANTPVPGATGTVDVTIVNFAFDPASITIKVGTTVRWINQDSAGHSVTSDTGIWDSGNVAQGATYSRVFDTVGTFAYHCGIHPSMKGTIIVTS
jgi:plastocyanin